MPTMRCCWAASPESSAAVSIAAAVLVNVGSVDVTTFELTVMVGASWPLGDIGRTSETSESIALDRHPLARCRNPDSRSDVLVIRRTVGDRRNRS